KITSFSYSGGGEFDVSDNRLIVTTPNSVPSVTAAVASGRNGGGWNGAGLVTSQSAAQSSNFTTLGVATASQVLSIAASATATWGGQTITGGDTLVMYTYG